jgi:hypothetical protein
VVDLVDWPASELLASVPMGSLSLMQRMAVVLPAPMGPINKIFNSGDDFAVSLLTDMMELSN